VLEKNNPKTYLVVSLLIISLAFPVAIRTNPYATAQTSPMSVHQYDKLKNCTLNLSKRPNSIEYLTYFNCGHISEGNGTTLRDFTLIIEENQKIPYLTRAINSTAGLSTEQYPALQCESRKAIM
jgi:hypothetical protein